MSKSKTSKPAIIATPLESRTTPPAKPVKAQSANEAKRQIKAAEGEQRAHHMMKDHNCCYDQCLEEGMIHIGVNGSDSHWICWRHLDRWNQTRARFLADGGGCAMQRLEELLDQECWDEVAKADFLS
jgi:hypothetical protein